MKFSLYSGAGSEKLNDYELACSLIQNAELSTKHQSDSRDTVLEFISQHDDWLWRSCLEGHLTASALIIDPVSKKILLIHHKKLDLWLQPGGHADGDGNLVHVAAKEVIEETGLSNFQIVLPAFDIDVHRIPAFGEDQSHLHLDLRFVLVASSTSTVINHEVNAAIWVDLDDLRLKDGNLQESAEQAIKIVEQLS